MRVPNFLKFKSEFFFNLLFDSHPGLKLLLYLMTLDAASHFAKWHRFVQFLHSALEYFELFDLYQAFEILEFEEFAKFFVEPSWKISPSKTLRFYKGSAVWFDPKKFRYGLKSVSSLIFLTSWLDFLPQFWLKLGWLSCQRLFVFAKVERPKLRVDLLDFYCLEYASHESK